MKFLKKLNRGLILTVLVLIGVAAYLITLGVIHRGDKADIKDLVSEYLEAQNGAFFLSEEALGDASFNSDAALAKIKATLSPFFAEETASGLDETVRTTLYQQERQHSLGKRIEKAESRIQKMTGYDFEGNYAEVTVTVSLVYDGPGELCGERFRENATFSYESSFSFICVKEQGEWKLIDVGGYENLATWNVLGYEDDVIYITAGSVKKGGDTDGSAA